MKGLALILIALTALSTNAGPRVVGNSARALVCEDNKVTLLDIYESEVVYGLDVLLLHNYLFTQVLDLYGEQIDRLRNFEPGTGYRELMQIYATVRFTPRATRLADLDDNTEILVPDDLTVPGQCKMRQIANYKNDRLLLIDSAFWEKMDPFNKATLILHEWVYKVMRSWGDTDSNRSRRIVSHMVSIRHLYDIYDGIPKKVWHCRDRDIDNALIVGGRFDFYAYPHTDSIRGPGVALQFKVFDGKIQFTRARVWLNDLDMAGFRNLALIGPDFRYKGRAQITSPLLDREMVHVHSNGNFGGSFYIGTGPANAMSSQDFTEVKCAEVERSGYDLL